MPTDLTHCPALECAAQLRKQTNTHARKLPSKAPIKQKGQHASQPDSQPGRKGAASVRTQGCSSAMANKQMQTNASKPTQASECKQANADKRMQTNN